MVQRKGLKKAAIGSKDAKRGSQDDDERLGKRKMGGRRVQRKGELDLSNPMIPADLDEDIDDDLAFNSDDEAKYGHLFSKAEEPASRKKGTTKAGKQGGLSSEFDRLNAYGDNDDDLFSDDSRDGFDLSEMLDSREDRKQAKAARRNKKEGRKTAPNDLLTREAESLLGPVAEGTRKPAGLHDLINNAPEGAAARRLDASMRNKKNLLSEEVDELVKERTGRTKTREAVADKLKQYTTILNVHSDAAHLKFPLQVPNANPVPGTLGSLTTALGAKQNSVTESSKKMNDLLRAAGLGGLRPSTTAPDEQIKFSTDDAADDDEQVTSHEKPSAGYMMKLKSMLSYEIAKRKRFNKIKSKTYRRILRKEKDREQERRDKAFELLNPEAAKARMQEKMEKLRAEERATQKHKNTSKWVKHAKAFAKFDDDTKDAINEQHALRQRLMAKMTEDAGAEFEDAADNVSESSEEEMRVDELLKGDKDVSSILWQDSGKTSTDATPTDKARSELFQMSFMTRAKERSNAQLEAEAAALQEDIKQYQEGRELTQASNRLLNKREKKARQALDDEEEGDAPKQSTRNAVNKSAGRTKVAENPQHLKHSVTLKQQRGARSTEESAVPAGEIDLDRDEEQWDESAHTAAATGTNTNEFAGSRRATPTPSTRVRVLPVSTKRQREEEPSQSAVVSFAEQKEEEVDLQQYLIARAFAADDIDADFLKAKEAQVESIMKPEDKNASLPGWGEWGGEDERLNKQHKKRAEVSQMQRRIQMTTLMKARADAQLNNVIINHDVDIVPDRHTLHMVPRPFSNPTEFARSMRQPLGPEWNTSLSFKEGAQPRITTTQGVAIDPLDLHSQRKKAKTVRRKLAKKNSD